MVVRCQNNVMARRYLVAEFDDARLAKRQQAQLASALVYAGVLWRGFWGGDRQIVAGRWRWSPGRSVLILEGSPDDGGQSKR